MYDTLDFTCIVHVSIFFANAKNHACELLACREFGVYPMARRKKAGRSVSRKPLHR